MGRRPVLRSDTLVRTTRLEKGLAMSKWRILTILLALVGVAFVTVAIIYWVEPAGSLPSFFPGHVAGAAYKHLKHGAVAVVVGIFFWVGAWFSSAKK